MAASILFDGRASAGFTKSGSTWVNGVDIYQINQEITNDAGITIASDPLGQRGSVWKFTLERALDYDGGTDKARAELSPPNSGSAGVGPPRDTSDVYMAKGVDLWFCWRFALATDFVFADDATAVSNDVILLQIHDKPGTSSRVAPWHLILVNDMMEIRNTYSTSVDYHRLLWKRRAVPGMWYSVVVNALWDDTAGPSSGYQHIWVNGRKVFRETAALNTYATDNSPGPWPKCSGYYYPHGLPANFNRNTVYQSGLVIGTEYASFDAFMLAASEPDTELEPFLANVAGST